MPWNPDQYHKFQAARSAPFEDIAALITVREGLCAVDLGCGTGELTRKLADRLPGCEMLGIDNSPEMLGRAIQHERDGVWFELGTVEDFAATADEWDLIFSHATLHWIPDHRKLMPMLLAKVRPGGQIAVLVGKPAQAGPYAFRLKFPADYKVMPHSHPDERIYTVLSGTWYIGLGDKFDPVKLKAFPAGSIYVVPAKIHHFHWAKSGESIVQVNAVGPTATDYVDPANDPRKK